MEGIENLIEYCCEYLNDRWEKINEIAENGKRERGDRRNFTHRMRDFCASASLVNW